jgi:hypothetical protein
MSGQSNADTRPAAEGRIRDALSGEAQRNALDFIAFLRENAISLSYNAGETESNNAAGWNGAVGGIVGNSIGYLYVSGEENCPGPWTFWFNSCDFEGSDSADDEFKNAIWAFASPCGRCSDNWEKCRGSGKRTILGKEFENQCHSPLMFTDPDAGTLENMKKFLIYLKPEIDGIQAGIEREKAAAGLL